MFSQVKELLISADLSSFFYEMSYKQLLDFIYRKAWWTSTSCGRDIPTVRSRKYGDQLYVNWNDNNYQSETSELFIIQHCLPLQLYYSGAPEAGGAERSQTSISFVIGYDIRIELLMIWKKNNFLHYNLLVPVIFLIMISFLWFFFDRFIVKFFFIMQISYWIHCFPELYFQKVKKVSTEKKTIQCEK